MPRGTFCAPRRIGIQFLCHKLWPSAPCSGSAGTGTLYVLFYDTYSPFLRPAGGRFGGRRCSLAPPRAGRNQRAARARYAPRTRAARRAPGAPGWCGARRPGGGAADATSEPGCGMSRQCPQTRGGAVPQARTSPGGWTLESAREGGRKPRQCRGGAPPGAARGRGPARESVRGDRLAAPRVRARRVRLRRARVRRSPEESELRPAGPRALRLGLRAETADTRRRRVDASTA